MKASRRDTVQPPIDFGRPAAADDVESADGSEGNGSNGRARPSPDRPTRRALMLLGVIAAIGIVQVGFLLFVEADRTLRHRTAIGKLDTELSELQQEADALRAVAARAGDVTFREQLARRQGFLYPDETRVIVLAPESDR